MLGAIVNNSACAICLHLFTDTVTVYRYYLNYLRYVATFSSINEYAFNSIFALPSFQQKCPHYSSVDLRQHMARNKCKMNHVSRVSLYEVLAKYLTYTNVCTT